MLTRIVLLVACCLHFALAVGQIDSLVLLEPIEVVGQLLHRKPIGVVSTSWDRKQLDVLMQHNLGEILSQSSQVFVKSYGSGSIATASVRGGSANHVAVLWNGLPIHNRMLGQMDLSLVNPIMVDRVTLQKGGGTALWSSGAVSGAVIIQNEADFTTPFVLKGSSTIGSFGTHSQSVRCQAGNKVFSSVSRLFHEEAQNDFPYQNPPQVETTRQTNNKYRNVGGMQSFYWNRKSRDLLSTHFWIQSNKRQVPPRLSQRFSDAKQDDRSFRTVVSYLTSLPKAIVESRLAYISDYQKYVDLQSAINAVHFFHTFSGDISIQQSWKKVSYQAGSRHSYTKARSQNYANRNAEYRGSLFLTGRYLGEKWQLQTSLRQEIIDQKWAPVVPDLGISFEINEMLSLHTKVSRDYRMPTLNDRFWQPGGNADLLPEHGWSQEASGTFQSQIKQVSLTYRLTGFNRRIHDWILWSKADDHPLWESRNIAKVWSRGTEQQLTLLAPIAGAMGELSCSHQWTRATNQIEVSLPNLKVGDQLFYTPMHQWGVRAQLNFTRLLLGYAHQIVGPYPGINKSLPGYNLGNLEVRWKQDVGRIPVLISAHLTNLFNASYQIVEERPMPGISYQLRLSINIEKPYKTTSHKDDQ